MLELSKILSQITNHQIGYSPVSNADFGKIYHDPELVTMYLADAQGLLDCITNDLEKLIGQSPVSLEQFLLQNFPQTTKTV